MAERRVGRPRTEEPDRVTTSVRLNRNTHTRLVAAAREREVSVNLLVSRAIDHYLDRLLPVEAVVFTREPEGVDQ